MDVTYPYVSARIDQVYSPPLGPMGCVNVVYYGFDLLDYCSDDAEKRNSTNNSCKTVVGLSVVASVPLTVVRGLNNVLLDGIGESIGKVAIANEKLVKVILSVDPGITEDSEKVVKEEGVSNATVSLYDRLNHGEATEGPKKKHLETKAIESNLNVLLKEESDIVKINKGIDVVFDAPDAG